MAWLVIGIFACVTSYLCVRVARAWALRRNVVDLPGERRLHSIPTPRVGGIG